MGVGEMQVLSSIIIIWNDKNNWIMKYKVAQSKYLETVSYNMWALTI